jgi:hypothetical protein
MSWLGSTAVSGNVVVVLVDAVGSLDADTTVDVVVDVVVAARVPLLVQPMIMANAIANAGRRRANVIRSRNG